MSMEESQYCDSRQGSDGGVGQEILKNVEASSFERVVYEDEGKRVRMKVSFSDAGNGAIETGISFEKDVREWQYGGEYTLKGAADDR